MKSNEKCLAEQEKCLAEQFAPAPRVRFDAARGFVLDLYDVDYSVLESVRITEHQAAHRMISGHPFDRSD